ncbi:unnamed protein product [Ceratitis capitata]|uniref:(Mediterranean fruit fly) hypothetical protein n=1 Tax=Ceratitis capitata TaxID=7213 RepID=A0A811UWA7_CERCA|nr:unnamed protein product [Ceratitis capitata]
MATKQKLLVGQKNLAEQFNTWLIKLEGRKTRATEEAKRNITSIRERFISNHQQLIKLGVENESYFTSNYFDDCMRKSAVSLEKYNAECEEVAEASTSKNNNMTEGHQIIKEELEDQISRFEKYASRSKEEIKNEVSEIFLQTLEKEYKSLDKIYEEYLSISRDMQYLMDECEEQQYLALEAVSGKTLSGNKFQKREKSFTNNYVNSTRNVEQVSCACCKIPGHKITYCKKF